MTITEIKEKLKTEEYNFLKTNPHLGENICLLTLGGSHAYGLATPTSDLDIRGIATHTPRDIFSNHNFEQVVETTTDTIIYSVTKMINLLSNVNPNTIEILGCHPEDYLYLNEDGKDILEHKDIFLSKRCLGAFAGYAGAQLARLENYVYRESLSQPKREEHIRTSMESAMRAFHEKYAKFDEGAIRLYADKAVNEDMESEIFMDCDLKHYPVRDYKMMWEELNNIVKTYKHLGHRNAKKDDLHLNKHIMHLFRLYLMAIDILEKCEINTYRGADHDYLMAICNGYYMNEDGTIKKELYEELDRLKTRVEEAKKTTKLPDRPNYKEIEDLLVRINKRAVERGMVDGNL